VSKQSGIESYIILYSIAIYQYLLGSGHLFTDASGSYNNRIGKVYSLEYIKTAKAVLRHVTGDVSRAHKFPRSL
jgi:hypothetical protein